MADFNEYKGVWVFCEQRQGILTNTRACGSSASSGRAH